eukprot:COSAG01_NODE_11678_length_1882_cov_1.293326_2_plen_139_part_00
MHKSVIAAMSDALAYKMSNIGYDYASSIDCMGVVAVRARDMFCPVCLYANPSHSHRLKLHRLRLASGIDCNIGCAASACIMHNAQEGRAAAADFLNCQSQEVVFGPSMTALAYELATVIAPTLSAGTRDDNQQLLKNL